MKIIPSFTVLAAFAALIGAVGVNAARAEVSRSVALVLDASGSMNANLPDGQSRLDAAKAAVGDLVGKMDGSTRLALRAYGHQSAPKDRNCKDSALLVGFDSVSNNNGAVAQHAQGIVAQGYTPITYSLTLAAQDVAKEESSERVIVLISDGQETCDADPCAAAKAIAAADAKLAIHTIGFGVGAAARTQLQCIANVARGRYFDANSAGDLNATLGKAAAATAVTKNSTETKISIKKPLPSRLLIKGTDAGQSHAVTNAEDDKQVADVNGAHGGEGPIQELPPGIYNVAFANGLWRGVEIKPGETTALELGTLTIENGQNDLQGYALLDPETEQVLRTPHVFRDVALIPGRVTISNGSIAWPAIEIRPGEKTHLNPARFLVRGVNARDYKVTTADGRPAGIASRLLNLPVPPGKYAIDVEGQQVTVELSEGQEHTIEVE